MPRSSFIARARRRGSPAPRGQPGAPPGARRAAAWPLPFDGAGRGRQRGRVGCVDPVVEVETPAGGTFIRENARQTRPVDRVAERDLRRHPSQPDLRPVDQAEERQDRPEEE